MIDYSDQNQNASSHNAEDPYNWDRFRQEKANQAGGSESRMEFAAPVVNTRSPRHKKHGTRLLSAFLGVALAAGMLGSAAMYFVMRQNTESLVEQAVARAINSAMLTPSSSGSSTSYQTDDFSDVIEKAADSVVAISAEVNGYQYRGSTAQSDGSGVIISADGYIVTCEHVIDGASSVKVYLNDGTEYDATVKGYDTSSDIAVLKIDATGLTPVTIGDSSLLELGDNVIVIGNPLGELNGSVTVGVVSALNRSISVGSSTIEVLQTDAAINPGNSGGALLNSQGQLVGIVNAKSTGLSVEGLGFAIPFNNIKSIVVQLMTYGYIKDRS